MNAPRLYIVTGLPYSGKSVLSHELIKRFGFSYASVDAEITKGNYDVTKMSQQDWNDVYTRAYESLEWLLRSGKTTIFDGASLTRHERQNLRSIAKDCSAEPVLIYVNTPFEETMQRRARNVTTEERAHLQDETVAKAKALFEEPGTDEQPIIYSSHLDLEQWIKDQKFH